MCRWYILVVLPWLPIAPGSLCPDGCSGVLHKDTCFQNANNKSYCLCSTDNICRSFSECGHLTDDARGSLYNDTSSESNLIFSNMSSICFIEDSCPVDFTDNNIRVLCEAMLEGLVHYDLFPVQVKENGFPNLNFKNKYCAICNGKFNYTFWNIGIDLDTCDLFSLETYVMSTDEDNLLTTLSRTHGCHVFPIELDPVCAVCEYLDSVVFFEGLPVLSALFNFSPVKEVKADDKSTKLGCGNKTPSNVLETAGVCRLGEMNVSGICQKVFSNIKGTYEFQLYEQMFQHKTNEQAYELTDTYIALLHATGKQQLKTDKSFVKRWNVEVHQGQTIKGDACVELKLTIIVHITKSNVDENSVRDAIIPCSKDSSSYVCFVSAENPVRDDFCQIPVQCDHLHTNVQHTRLERLHVVQYIITFISLSLSILALLISVFVFLKCPIFHNLPGRINLCMMMSILCAQLLYLLSASFYNARFACLVIGVVTHYMWLCSFAWMSICAIHTWFTFGRTDLSRTIHPSEKKFWLRRYCLAALSFPLLLVLFCLFLDLFLPGFTMGYGKGVCFITNPLGITIGFASPVGISLLINLILFVATVINIHRGPKIVNDIRSSHTFFIIYTKLSSLMGFTWISAYIAEIAGVNWLKTLSTIVNGLQGVFIFVSFVCNKRVCKWICHNVTRQNHNT